jgi:C-terminal processing protease CtpA/Prc
MEASFRFACLLAATGLLTLAALALTFSAGCLFGPRIGSVGAVLGKDVHTGRLFVRDVPPAMPAAAAGLREGDEVLSIDGKPVDDLSPQEVHKRLKGPIGTTVTLVVSRHGETLRVEVQRGPLATNDPY